MKLLTALLVYCMAVSFISGCDNLPSEDIEIQIHSTDSPDAVLVITTELNGTSMTVFYRLPSGERIFLIERENLYSVWDDGVLTKEEGDTAWLNLNVDTWIYENAREENFSGWNIPVGVNPDAGSIYVLAHQVPPTNSIQAQYLDGSEEHEFGQFIGDELEFLSPLPSNGWTIFYKNYSAQGGNITPDYHSDTWRTRVYIEEEYVGEYENVDEVYPLDGCIILLRDGKWELMEKGPAYGASTRDLSFSQIDGTPRPLLRFGDKILVSFVEKDDDGALELSRLFFYGIYTREIDWVHDFDSGEAFEAVSCDRIDDENFLLSAVSYKTNNVSAWVLTGSPDSMVSVTRLATASMPNEPAEAFIYYVDMEIAQNEEETVEIVDEPVPDTVE